MKTDIWSERIQELILSGEDKDILLAYGLLEDKNILYYWCWLGKREAEMFKLPYITLQVCARVNKLCGTIPTDGSHIDKLHAYSENRYYAAHLMDSCNKGDDAV